MKAHCVNISEYIDHAIHTHAILIHHALIPLNDYTKIINYKPDPGACNTDHKAIFKGYSR